MNRRASINRAYSTLLLLFIRAADPVAAIDRHEGEEMIGLRFVVSAVLVAAAAAGCITYFASLVQPQQVEADQRLPPTVPDATGRPYSGISTNRQRRSTEERIDAFERAAEAILKNATASAGADRPLITGPIPLPKRRPILGP